MSTINTTSTSTSTSTSKKAERNSRIAAAILATRSESMPFTAEHIYTAAEREAATATIGDLRNDLEAKRKSEAEAEERVQGIAEALKKASTEEQKNEAAEALTEATAEAGARRAERETAALALNKAEQEHAAHIQQAEDALACWSAQAERVRLAISECAVHDYAGKEEEAAAKRKKSAFFEEHKKALAIIEQTSEQAERVHASAADFAAVEAISAAIRRASAKKGQTRREFLPLAKKSFRKAYEIFLCDRWESVVPETAAEILTRQAAERKARAEERKAQKVKDAAQAGTEAGQQAATAETAQKAAEAEKASAKKASKKHNERKASKKASAKK